MITYNYYKFIKKMRENALFKYVSICKYSIEYDGFVKDVPRDIRKS